MTLTDQQRRRVDLLIYGRDEGEGPGDGTSDDADERHRRFSEVLAEVEVPEELFHYASHYNWDDGFERLAQVIDHPFCDRGTALVVFWLSEPAAAYQRASAGTLRESEREWYDLLKRIESKYLSGGFSSRRIAVDPRDMFGADWVVDGPGETGSELIPDELKAPSPGQELERLEF